jgi:hypothetical protein
MLHGVSEIMIANSTGPDSGPKSSAENIRDDRAAFRAAPLYRCGTDRPWKGQTVPGFGISVTAVSEALRGQAVRFRDGRHHSPRPDDSATIPMRS